MLHQRTNDNDNAIFCMKISIIYIIIAEAKIFLRKFKYISFFGDSYLTDVTFVCTYVAFIFTRQYHKMFLIPHFKYNQGALSEESDTFRTPLCLFIHLFLHTRDASEKVAIRGWTTKCKQDYTFSWQKEGTFESSHWYH